MPTFPVIADTDLTSKPKYLAAWHFRATGSAGVINLRNGSVSGDIVVPINIPVNTSDGQSYKAPGGYLLFPGGLFVDVVGAGSIVGSVDLR